MDSWTQKRTRRIGSEENGGIGAEKKGSERWPVGFQRLLSRACIMMLKAAGCLLIRSEEKPITLLCFFILWLSG